MSTLKLFQTFIYSLPEMVQMQKTVLLLFEDMCWGETYSSDDVSVLFIIF